MRTSVLLAGLSVLVSACDRGSGPAEPALQASVNAVSAWATGGGHYLLSNVVDTEFSFSASQSDGGKANGAFHVKLEDAGFTYDIHGAVTCLAVDALNRRAWIGGVITRNETTDPDLQQDIHQVGRDVWFRVLDAGEGHGAVDRLTFYGFEGGGGIITSEQYCAARIWPDDNARTWPVTSGNISVRP